MQRYSYRGYMEQLQDMVQRVGYPSFNRGLVVSQLREALLNHELTPVIARYVPPTAPSAAPAERICLNGKLNFISQGKSVHIFIRVWVLINFPHDPPLIYIVPFREYAINPNHPALCVDGRANIGMLRMGNWQPKLNTINMALLSLASEFSSVPPLVADPALRFRKVVQNKIAAALSDTERDAKSQLRNLQSQARDLEQTKDLQTSEDQSVAARLSSVRQSRMSFEKLLEEYAGPNNENITVDEAVAAASGNEIVDLCAELKAKDYAITDTLRLFIESCESTDASLDEILRHTKNLASEQFTVRVQLSKACSLIPRPSET